ncbi:MAG: hypothetical protein ACXVHB_14840 [Solirubrobacteraceae bacterium]
MPTAETTSDPAQPKRFEKNKNIVVRRQAYALSAWVAPPSRRSRWARSRSVSKMRSSSAEIARSRSCSSCLRSLRAIASRGLLADDPLDPGEQLQFIGHGGDIIGASGRDSRLSVDAHAYMLS